MGLALLLGLLLGALLAPLLAPYSPYARVGAPFSRPSWEHPLGTNDIGQDLLSELIYGARISLLLGLLGTLAATALGTAVGTVAGTFGRPTDTVLMRLVDITLALPFLPLMIVIGVFLGPGLLTQILVISAVLWARPARELRSQVLSARERGHVQAARAMGAPRGYVLLRHILPQVLPLVVPQLVQAAKLAILAEASLSFLGLGDPTTKSWGTMLFYANARSAFLTRAWLWWVVPPGVAIAATLIAFAFLGSWLEEHGRPRLRGAGPTPAPEAGLAPLEAGGGDGLLRVEGLSVAYGRGPDVVAAVQGASLAVGRGEVFGLVGESGSGKSTLALAILGLLDPPARILHGRILLDGKDVIRMPEYELRPLRGRLMSLIPQSAMNSLNPVYTILDQLTEAMTAHGQAGKAQARARATRLLGRIGIPPDRWQAYPHQLSGGMRQRVVLAMALANHPRLVIADEPTTGLDILLQDEILSLLQELRAERGTALLLISHDLSVVLRDAARLAVMQGGRMVEQGPARRLAHQPQHPYTRRLVESSPRLRLGDGHRPPPASRGAPLLEVREVYKAFPGRRWGPPMPVLRGVSLDVGEGEVVGLVGVSGVGKTTLARLILGLERLDGGRIRFEGRDLARLTPAQRRGIRRRLQFVFQDPYDALPPGMRVEEIVAEPLQIHGLGSAGERRERVRQALEEVGLVGAARYLGRYPHELSGGERQRVALARATILRPRLILADEPTSMLDASLRLDLLDLMRRLGEHHGTAYLYITHDLALAAQFCHRLVVLHRGRVVEEGPVDRIFREPRHPHTRDLIRAVERLGPDRYGGGGATGGEPAPGSRA